MNACAQQIRIEKPEDKPQDERGRRVLLGIWGRLSPLDRQSLMQQAQALLENALKRSKR